jgi:formylmethanofuran dehydrogenase subunit E
MALAAMAALGVERAGDEELVAIAENSACGVDALQLITGCTFGKGNLVFLDHGKPVFTLFSRTTGKGVRVLFRDGAIPPEFRLDREQRLAFILAVPEGEILSLGEPALPLPEKARIFTTLTCARCGEPVMETRLRETAGRQVCLPCAAGD